MPERSNSHGVLHGRRRSRPEINVTPLIDILLGLIIVFMVIVAMSKEYMVEAQLTQPADGKQPHENERTIVIQVTWSAQSEAPMLRSAQQRNSARGVADRVAKR